MRLVLLPTGFVECGEIAALHEPGPSVVGDQRLLSGREQGLRLRGELEGGTLNSSLFTYRHQSVNETTDSNPAASSASRKRAWFGMVLPLSE
jgi:hypothetical protein